MRKKIWAICDPEELYAGKLMQVLKRRKSLPFEIQAYTDLDKLSESAGREQIEILLISEKMLEERVYHLPVGQIMILSEGARDPSDRQYQNIYKYQSVDTLLREVMKSYGPTNQPSMPGEAIAKKPMEIYGIYSPVGRVGKTSLALTMGQILAKEHAVLYLNFECYSGFEFFLQKNWESNFSDLIYFVKQRSDNLCERLCHMTATLNDLDYLAPVLAPSDISTAGIQDWDFLLDELELHSPYEFLILDLGDGLEEPARILDRCDKIFMPVLDDGLSQGKIAQFETLLRLWDAMPLLERIRRLHLPDSGGSGQGEQYLEQLLWGDFGSFVRDLLREEEK